MCLNMHWPLLSGFFTFSSKIMNAVRARPNALLRRVLRPLTLATAALFFVPATVLPDAADGAGQAQLQGGDLNEVFAHLETRIRRVELPNGLRLILMRQDYAPTVACYMKFKAGSADETDASSGIAHMLEHMLFKGTPRVGTRDYAREKKYLEQEVSFAQKLDHWRRVEQSAVADGDEALRKTARPKIAWYEKQLRIIQSQVRPLVIEEEDSYLYSLHGQRGYNAYTTADLTNYQIELPANRLEVWARMESDRMQNSVLRSFYTERSVVTEERRMRVDNSPRRQLFEKFITEIYGDHPYGRPVIGPMASIEFLNYEQAMRFYETYYAPNNSVIALVGDIDFDQAEQMVRRYFGKMQSRTIPRLPEPKIERRPVRLVMREDGPPTLSMAWFKPPLPDPDDLNLDLLSDVLAGGQETRLYRRLVTQEQLAVDVGAFSGYPGERYTNLFFVEVTPRPGVDEAGMKKIEAIVQAEIDAIVANGVRPEELERVRNKQRADFIYQLRANGYLADLLSYYESVTGDYRNLFRYNARIEQVTSTDIQNSVAKYLKGDDRMTAMLVPPAPDKSDSEKSDSENSDSETSESDEEPQN